MKKEKILGTMLIIIILILTAMSVATIASLSYPMALYRNNDSYFFVKRQIFWIILGFMSFFVTSKIDYKKYKKWSIYIYILGLILLILVYFIGKEVNGSKRWIGIGSVSIQPSEFAKIFLIIFMADFLSMIKNWKRGMTSILVITLIYIGLIIKEALSSSIQLILIILVMLFIVIKNIKNFLVTLVIFFVLAYGFVMIEPYRKARFSGWRGSEMPYQVKQSLIAVGSGEILGKNYGKGLQKNFFLPEIHTDYIFSGYLEENGFLGGLFLIALYLVLLGIIMTAILKVKDKFARNLLIGIFTMLASQIFLNMGIALGILPSTGVPLPLMSYGGSTLIVVMSSLGIVYNIIKSIYIDEIRSRMEIR